MPTLEAEIAKSLSLVLLSHAAHGLGTGTLGGLGEITLRDGLVVAAAAVGSRRHAAWIINREYKPPDWERGNIDLTVWRKHGQQKQWFCSTELKWWHQDEVNNAANRRSKLLRDFIRAGAVYPLLAGPEKISLVLLLSTKSSWSTTVERHKAGDKAVCHGWKRAYRDHPWDISALKDCPSVRSAVSELRSMGVQIPNIVHSDLVYSVTIGQQRSEPAEVRCWSVRKPQNTIFLDDEALDEIAGQ